MTPGPVVPAREMYADLLMELGRPAEALAEYEASLQVAPNRSYALAGAVRAAGAAGQDEKARALYATLEKVTAARRPRRGRSLAKLKASRKAGG